MSGGSRLAVQGVPPGRTDAAYSYVTLTLLSTNSHSAKLIPPLGLLAGRKSPGGPGGWLNVRDTLNERTEVKFESETK